MKRTWDEMCELLEKQAEEIKQLKKRMNLQYKRIVFLDDANDKKNTVIAEMEEELKQYKVSTEALKLSVDDLRDERDEAKKQIERLRKENERVE